MHVKNDHVTLKGICAWFTLKSQYGLPNENGKRGAAVEMARGTTVVYFGQGGALGELLLDRSVSMLEYNGYKNL